MIKKFLLAIALAVPMFVSAQTLKVGVIDTAAVMQAMPEATEAQNKYAESSKKLEDEYGRLQEEMKRQYDELQKMGDDELPAIRERKIREFQDYQAKVQQFENDAMKDLQELQAQLMQPIALKVRQAIESVGKENSYSMILDNNPQTLLYFGSPVEDITPLVKTKLGVK